MLNLEVDGKPVQVPNGSTVMDAGTKLGIYIPYFCYHKKLSIAANCRMCLVQVEKAPKPLPACATPATEGMKVWTHSVPAVNAQKGVMEFLLINHPLDCPICDQGGECQLQDLAVGYGASNSRYDEPKRVVLNKNLGSLISTDMTRCIHCTRCVRFGQEIAGIMELGMANRGEHAEIMTFVGRTVDSELSGNMIDLCPVGALTSKPFRYTARNWELSRRKSISPHDGLGSNLIVQIKNDRVMRVLPFENEAINECWLSDRDRFSYEGLNSDERLTGPMVKEDGQWKSVDWQVALETVVGRLKDIHAQHGANAIAALASPHSTVEELYLVQKLVRGLGSDNIDFRLRQSDFSIDFSMRREAPVPWLGMPLTKLAECDRVLVIGSFLRKEQPLLAHRLRQAAKRGTHINVLHVTDDDLLMLVANRSIVSPDALPRALATIVDAAKSDGTQERTKSGDGEKPTSEEMIAASLANGKRSAILLGAYAQQHPRAGALHALARQLAQATGATLGFLTEAANTVGAHLVKALPQGDGLNAQQLLATPTKAYLVLHTEPELDAADPATAVATLAAADLTVVLSPFRHGLDYADVLLPIAPFTETAGTFVNTEGKAQSFHGVVKPLGATRPGWKVLRVLGSMLDLPGFEFDAADAVRREALGGDAVDLSTRLSGAVSSGTIPTGTAISNRNDREVADGALQRIAEVPIYAADPLVRRAPSLQKTADARAPAARVSGETLQALGIAAGERVLVRAHGEGCAVVLELARDETVPSACVRIATAHPSTAALGNAFGAVTVVRA